MIVKSVNLLRKYVNPIIYSFWLRMQTAMLEKLMQSGKPLDLTADGQYDSPGYSARQGSTGIH
jgi:hypothetical protein